MMLSVSALSRVILLVVLTFGRFQEADIETSDPDRSNTRENLSILHLIFPLHL